MSAKTPTVANSSTANFSSGKFLTFRLADALYGIEVLFIREIVRMQTFTPVPEMPAYVKGVTNLRGKVTPVIDLREKFGLQPEDSNHRNCVIVVDLEDGEGASDLLGLIVDSVEEVLQIHEFEMESPSNSGKSKNIDSRLGVAIAKGSKVNLLDVKRLLPKVTSSDFAI